MAQIGKFDTDTTALTKRIKAHDKYGSNDLNSWIFKNLNIKENHTLIDLGCGTGKQSIPSAKVVGEEGHVFSIDLSQEALTILQDKATQLNLNKQITTICSRHDDIDKHLKASHYDSIVSSYSLYYAEDANKVISTIWGALKPKGVLFFCGPSSRNNEELKKLHYGLKGTAVPTDIGGATFMEGVGQRISRELFDQVEVSLFENPLKFDSAKALYTYWSSYNLYDETIDEEFKAEADKYFKNHNFFITTKRVIGVKAIK